MTLLSTAEAKSLLADSNCSLLHINARSLCKNQDSITAFIDALGHSFSFLCISETWLGSSDGNLYGFRSFQSEYCHRSSDRHGGSAIFISSEIKYERRLDLRLNVSNCESVWIETNTSPSSNRKSLIIGCIYRSPSSSIPDFLHNLSTVLHKISAENKQILIVGDININLMDAGNSSVTLYSDCFVGFGLESLITSPTRFSASGTNTLLDHALSNITPSPSAGVIDMPITDHLPIFITFAAEKMHHDTSYFTSSFDMDNFVNTISGTNWASISTQCDPEKALQKFCSLFLKAVYASTTTVKCKKKFKFPCNPWITKGLLTSMRKKDNLYRKTKKKAVQCKPSTSL